MILKPSPSQSKGKLFFYKSDAFRKTKSWTKYAPKITNQKYDQLEKKLGLKYKLDCSLCGFWLSYLPKYIMYELKSKKRSRSLIFKKNRAKLKLKKWGTHHWYAASVRTFLYFDQDKVSSIFSVLRPFFKLGCLIDWEVQVEVKFGQKSRSNVSVEVKFEST